jgi:hypothetical protein
VDKHDGVGGFDSSHIWMSEFDHFRFLIHHCLMQPFSCEAIYKFQGVSSWGREKLPRQTIYKLHLLIGTSSPRCGDRDGLEFAGTGMRNFSPQEDRDGELSPNGNFTVHVPKSAVRKHADARPHKLTVSATKL